jgi:hypothetical protein
MERRSARRIIGILVVAVATLCPGLAKPRSLLAGLKRTASDPAQVVPLDQVAPHAREAVAEVIRDAHFHRQGKSETFPCNPRVYMKLLNEPPITLALWQDLADTPAKLQQVGPGRYTGSDGAGTSATWEFVLKSPRLNVLLCDLDYTSPRGNARLQGRIVLIVRSGYFREVNGEFWVQHDLEAFVKVDSRGWKAVAVTIRPIIEKVLEDQVQEAGWFVSLMGRLVETYPNWAIGVANKQAQIATETRKSFVDVVTATKKPGASDGRPVVADSGTTRMK